jgi:hypothetical protein
MKKLLIFLMGLLLISCNKNTTFYSEQEVKEMQYEQAFTQAFGTIDKNQTWGFSQTATTRSADPRGNMWASEGYNVPADITESEREAVLAVFSKKGKASYKALVDWDCFFVQQVYTGDSIYKDGYGQDVLGAQKMNWLCAYDPIGVKETKYLWSQEKGNYTEIVTNHDDHVNDFNAATSNDYGGRMLMVNSSTQRFGFSSSQDNGHVFYNFRMEVINGNYYVGLDFEAAGQNPNEQVARDYVYDDWIVKIVPGKGISDKVKEEGMIICEDLGNIGDFDFNDVVFYAKVWESGKTEITLLAAGGTLEIEVAGVRVGDVMGKMVNTGLKTVPTYYFVASNKYNSLIDIPIVVSNKDEAGHVYIYELTAEMGKAPQKICVPLGFKWCKEYKSLVDAYPGFKNWTSGKADTWCGEYNSELVMDLTNFNF